MLHPGKPAHVFFLSTSSEFNSPQNNPCCKRRVPATSAAWPDLESGGLAFLVSIRGGIMNRLGKSLISQKHAIASIVILALCLVTGSSAIAHQDMPNMPGM